MSDTPIQLTKYSHGAGCGCKISPKVLEEILCTTKAVPDNDRLIVGNHSKDDAAVFDLGNGTALISTTDFFMPIVDDPYDFGRIASANAISDVYAMGGKPMLAIAILGWPVNILPASVARRVIEGSRSICQEAGIPLAGGHSLDSPEPIFGLAVNGQVNTEHIKRNDTARAGDLLLLTKPLGVGILTTAEKKGMLRDEHRGIAARQMMRLNKAGEALGKVAGIHAMTDVTGFGLLGHLTEMAEGSGLSALVHHDRVPLIIDDLKEYLDQGSFPGGTTRNWDSYGHHIHIDYKVDPQYAKYLLADPQTSGGLLLAVDPASMKDVEDILRTFDLEAHSGPIGQIIPRRDKIIEVL